MFKPSLAVEADLAKLRFPCLASAKLDGIRAIVKDGVVLSRSLKPIPSAYVQSLFRHLDNADGELVVGPPTAKDCYRQTTSHVMAHEKVDFDVKFYAFDHILHPLKKYTERLHALHFDDIRNPRFIRHDQHVVMDMDSLLALETKMLDKGYEGLILRSPDAPYKYGRSTVKEGYLLKLKRFVDAEAEVIGFEERMHNGNEATTNELGRTRRSSHEAGKSGRGDLGAFVCRMDGITFNIGTGFDDAERAAIWNDKDNYLGRLVKFKYFPVGVKTAPRHPVYLGLREACDLDGKPAANDGKKEKAA